MTIGSVIMMFLIALWGFFSAYREHRLCGTYGHATTEWTWVCLGLGVLFTGLAINGTLILISENM